MLSRRLSIVGGGVLVLVLLTVAVVVGVRAWRSAHRTDFQQAVAMAPQAGQRFSWTDWAGVRRELGADLTLRSPADDVESFLSDGFSADLTSTSALVESARVLQIDYGFSPATVDWELFSQSPDGAAVMLKLPDSTDFADVADRLDSLGYARPSSATGVWQGGEDLIAALGVDGSITPELQYLTLDAADHLIFTSDTAGYLRSAVGDAIGSGTPATGLDEVVDASGEPLTAALYTGDYACGALAMGQADGPDQSQADQLMASSGEVNPFTAFAMSVQPDRDLSVAMSFESHDQAVVNADSRAQLAGGPAVGQGGDFADRFDLGPVSADGDVVTMALRPVPDTYVLSDLSTGPLLFATC